MHSHYIRIAHLVKLYLAGKIDADQMRELNEWQKEYPVIRQWLENKQEKNLEIEVRYQDYVLSNILSDWDRIKTRKPHNRNLKLRQGLLIAASLLILISLGIWLVQKPVADLPKISQVKKLPVGPATNQARLILSDGSTIGLEQQKDLVIEEGNLKMKVEDKKLDYSSLTSKKVFHHKIEVPRGGTYYLKLADGTNVWLNAESEMEFPTSFTGDERVVTLHGEAYFEVAKDPLKPFRVKVNGTVVEAVGTAFNINTHSKQDYVKTILTEGKIKVSDGEKTRFVNEGYASVSGGGKITVEKADLEEAMAWKDGYFYFNGKNLEEIMEEIARWYNVELKFETNVSEETYKGGIKRTESIKSVCRMLEGLSGYALVVTNRTLSVKPANRKPHR